MRTLLLLLLTLAAADRGPKGPGGALKPLRLQARELGDARRGEALSELRAAVLAEMRRQFVALRTETDKRMAELSTGLRSELKATIGALSKDLTTKHNEIADRMARASADLRNVSARLDGCVGASPDSKTELLSRMRQQGRASAVSHRKQETALQALMKPAESACGGDVELKGNTTAVVLTSPGYPRPYRPLTRCEWTITTALSSRPRGALSADWLLVTIADLDLEESSPCWRDALHVGALATRCGRGAGESLLVPASRTEIRFRADGSVAGRGFNLSVASVPAGCGGRLSATDTLQERTIDLSAGPGAVAGAVECTWTLSAGPRRPVLVVITTAGVNCTAAALRVLTDGRGLPQVCRRLQRGEVTLPVSASTVTISHRPAQAGTVRVSFRARADVERISVNVHSPTEWFIAVAFVPVVSGDRTWGDVRRKAKRHFTSRIDAAAVAYQWGCLHRRGRTTRRGIWDYSTYTFPDEVDGLEVPRENRTQYLFHFLPPGSPVRTCPGCVPRLYVLLSTRVAKVAAADPPRLQDADAAALEDPRSLLLLLGLEMTPGGPAANGSKIFIGTGYNSFSDGATGRHFNNRSAAAAAQTAPRQSWRHLILVLADGDPVPRLRVARGKTVWVLTRPWVEAAVEAGRVWRRRGHADPRDGTWVWAGRRLRKQVTAPMQR